MWQARLTSECHSRGVKMSCVKVSDQMRQHAVRVVRQCNWCDIESVCEIVMADSTSWRTVVAAMCLVNHDFVTDSDCQLVVAALARSMCLVYDIPTPSDDEMSMIWDDYAMMSE